MIAGQLVFCGLANADPVNTVFVIAMENHNWTQPVSDTSAPHQIYNNTNAPFINSIVNSGFNGGALNPQVTLYGASGPISINTQVSYATAYHNVLATASGANSHIHPVGAQLYLVASRHELWRGQRQHTVRLKRH